MLATGAAVLETCACAGAESSRSVAMNLLIKGKATFAQHRMEEDCFPTAAP